MINMYTGPDNTSSNDEWDNSLKMVTDRIADRIVDQRCIRRVIDRALQLERNASTDGPSVDRTSILVRPEKFEILRRRRIMVLLSGFSASAACLLVVGWFVSSSGNAFALVQQKLAETRTIQFSFRSTTADENSSGHVYIVGTDRFREELPDGRVFVTDLQKKQVLFLDTESKQGEVYPLYKTESKYRTLEWLARLQNAGANAAQNLGKRNLDGRDVVDYQILLDADPEFLKVTVDERSLLPVQVELVDSNSGQVSGYAFDFVFDKPIDDRLVSLTAPVGFEIVTVEQKSEAQGLRLVVGPDGLGPVKWGMKREKVVELLGKPDAVKQFDLPHQSMLDEKKIGRTSGDELIYDSQGYRVIVSKLNGVETITCYGAGQISDRMRPFGGVTDKGLRMGATLEDVIEVYGTPEQETETQLIYSKLGLQFQFNRELSLIQSRSPAFRPSNRGVIEMRVEP